VQCGASFRCVQGIETRAALFHENSLGNAAHGFSPLNGIVLFPSIASHRPHQRGETILIGNRRVSHTQKILNRLHVCRGRTIHELQMAMPKSVTSALRSVPQQTGTNLLPFRRDSRFLVFGSYTHPPANGGTMPLQRLSPASGPTPVRVAVSLPIMTTDGIPGDRDRPSRHPTRTRSRIDRPGPRMISGIPWPHMTGKHHQADIGTSRM
jgi:hypothetical protein